VCCYGNQVIGGSAVDGPVKFRRARRQFYERRTQTKTNVCI